MEVSPAAAQGSRVRATGVWCRAYPPERKGVPRRTEIASGLLAEAVVGGGHDGLAAGRLGGRRGIFLWLHGSESLRAAALSRTVTAGADGLVTDPDGQCRVL